MRLISLAFLLVASLAGQAAAQQAPARTEVLVKEVVLSDGTRRYTIPIHVGSVVIEAGLDTGSTGLRILPGVLGDADASASRHETTYAYGSGAKLDGVTGQAVVAVGSLSASTPVQLIRSVGCVDNKPRCPATRVALKDYGIQGDGLPGEGFKAIIGVAMGGAEIPNPLIQLGAKSWILDLPRPGESGPGRLILNPTPEETAGYMLFRLDPDSTRLNGGRHDSVQGCLINRQSRQSICGPTSMDSGAPGLRIVARQRIAPWPEGAAATLAFLEDGKPKLSVDFVVGQRAQASRFTTEERPEAPGTHLFTGLLPYFAYSVLYDPAHEVIGLKPREGFPSAR